VRRWASRLRRARLGVLLALLAVSGAGGAQAWGQDGRSDVVIDDPRVVESSGLAVAPTDDRLLYTVNDSGNEPVVYVVDRVDGQVVGTTTLAGVDSDTDDLEALAVGPDGRLWVADTGDNGGDRSDTALYALPAPGRGDSSRTPVAYPLEYADGPSDVEALLVDPVGGAGWLVTKGVFGGQLLRLPRLPAPGQPVTPAPVAGVDLPGLVTDGTVLPGGEAAVLRTYTDAYVYRLPGWTPAGSFVLPRQEQGETVTALSATLLLAGSEGNPALIDEVPVPRDVLAALAGPASPDVRPRSPEPPSGDGGESGPGTAVLVGAGSLAVGVALAALGLRAGRARRRTG